MLRLNFILLALLIACALALVTSQHRARKFYGEFEKEQDAATQLGIEWGQLQLEQGTWATHGRIEKLAGAKLGMRVPAATRVEVVTAASAAPAAPDTPAKDRQP